MNSMFAGIFGMLLGIGIGVAGTMFATLTEHGAVSQPYAGQETRQISSLSAEDIDELEKGAGWGLAKPAELNGYPGPAHVLEFEDKLDLTSVQKQAIEASFEAMKAKARELGVALIEAEKALDDAFAKQTITPSLLQERLNQSEDIRAALRNVHLAAHVEITPLLTESQLAQYAELRGYAEGHAGH